MWAVILIVALVGFMAVANANRGASSDNTSGQITATDTPQPTYTPPVAATQTAVVLATQDAALYATSAASITPETPPRPR